MRIWARTTREAGPQGHVSPLACSINNVSSMRARPSTCETPLPRLTHAQATACHCAVPPKSQHVVLKGLEELFCFRQCQDEVRNPLAVLLEGRSLLHVCLTTGIRADAELPLSFMRRPPAG
jgi:hypothetical protein